MNWNKATSVVGAQFVLIATVLGGAAWAAEVGRSQPTLAAPAVGATLVDKSLLILDDNGKTQELYRTEKMVHDPRVIRPRPREPVLPSRADLQKTTGQLVLTDVYRGRHMAGVKPGTIKKLLVLEDLPKPGSKHGLPGFHGGYITLRRVLGTVPVEADGSAAFEVPALRAVYFVALDENGVAVKRMQNFAMVMPGETQGCRDVGCHEARTGTPGSYLSGIHTEGVGSRFRPNGQRRNETCG